MLGFGFGVAMHRDTLPGIPVTRRSRARNRRSSVFCGEGMMKIGDMAKLFGIRTSKVRFLEAQGLVHPARNPFSGYRDYNETAVKQLSFILKAQSFGFRIEELRLFFVDGGGCEFSGDFSIERITIKLNEFSTIPK